MLLYQIDHDIEKFGHVPKDFLNLSGLSGNRDTKVILWGTGSPLREFLNADDAADAIVFIMNLPDDALKQGLNSETCIVNIGTGQDISIFELAQLIKDIVGYNGKISWDSTKPDGTPRKLMDVSKLNKLGWKSQISLKQGIKQTYEWYKST